MPTEPNSVSQPELTLIAVPDDLVPRLVSEFDALPIPSIRSSLVDVALIIGSNATSIVALTLTTRKIAALSRTVADLATTVENLEIQGQLGNHRKSINVSHDVPENSVQQFISDVEAPLAIEPHLRVGNFTAFISYAHDSRDHVESVKSFWRFLRSEGIDAQIDLTAQAPRDWPQWTSQEMRSAKYILVIASPAYKERAEGRAPEGEGRGVRWEAQQLRDMRYKDPTEALLKQLLVVLPGRSADELPDWLGPAGNTHYTINSFTSEGAKKLLRYLT